MIVARYIAASVALVFIGVAVQVIFRMIGGNSFLSGYMSGWVACMAYRPLFKWASVA